MTDLSGTSVAESLCTRCGHAFYWHDRFVGCEKRLQRGKDAGKRCKCRTFSKGTGRS